METIDSFFLSEEENDDENKLNDTARALQRKYRKCLLLLWLNTKFPDGLGRILTSHEIQSDHLKEWNEFYKQNVLLRLYSEVEWNLLTIFSKSSLDSSILESIQPVRMEEVFPVASPVIPSETARIPPNEDVQEHENESLEKQKIQETDLSDVPGEESSQRALSYKEAANDKKEIKDNDTSKSIKKELATNGETNEKEPSPLPAERTQTPDSEYAVLQLTKTQQKDEQRDVSTNNEASSEIVQPEAESTVSGEARNVGIAAEEVIPKSPTEAKHEVNLHKTDENVLKENNDMEIERRVIEETAPSSVIAQYEKSEAGTVDQPAQQDDSNISFDDSNQQRNVLSIPISTTEEPPVEDAAKGESQKQTGNIETFRESLTPSKPLFHLSFSLPFSLLPPSEFSVPKKVEDTLDAWLLRTEMIPLQNDLENAYKYVSTNNWMHAYKEKIVRESIRRVFNAKEKGTWSFRQPKRQKELIPIKTHHDYLLDEMQWMSIDFSQERRWKIVLAKQIVDSVMNYHNTSDKSTVCTPASLSKNKRPYSRKESDRKENSSDLLSPDFAKTKLDQYDSLQRLSPPRNKEFYSTIFSEDVVAITDLEESHKPVFNVPTYDPPSTTEKQLRASGITNPIAPISRFALAKTKLKSSCIHTERKRLFSERDIIPQQSETAITKNKAFENNGVTTESQEENAKKKRAFAPFTVRPPYPPLTTENTSEIVWLPEEDELLLLLLRQYSFNWEFIANQLTPSGLYVPNTERRTAWDCFERWIQIDPQAGNVQFTGSHARLAQQKLDESLQKSKQSTQNLRLRDSHTPMPRMMSQNSYFILPTISRHYRPVAIFEAIKKTLKQREFTQKTAIKRQTTNVPTPHERLPPVPSPIELSRLKLEREAQIQQLQSQRNANLYMQHQNQTKMRPTASIPGTPQYNLAAYQAAVSQNSSATSSTGNSPVLPRAVPRLQNRLDYPNSPRLAAEQIPPFQQR
ncbi:NuA4 histone acetyltransferase complex subunit Vid21 [Schizosaccharomyces octosporus yFS286]|uniref:Vacuolar import and degradation protein 21 n=1 Tax=Schizosaccharomyces octosporus (strain yFS286) TaxID=483514 RepID=S9PNQ4_SCHOY|nr:NuA4 histone acetyltransferase complex subunit Vid21 [Schizosaccharomyces octosporus yFS286]EPX70891.1 NuA4 histone acetyltransferase complex subunit Vid21 [Schizosaccharomyces octosporus yFS286]